ncbi:uncharacterized protein B0I36DRAFT_387582 [Microdochium trichocladiopsis]|uniref:BZIP domain-containing protein n=1 Tax=Microdochium trichocladiopsis TaxID=1682393 RepID=A0A9P9BK15_9PEZI|nr:uncharacterized protein B0I36DRAFT_387582 [Microdochium trichocladiopsis]KAH7020711.1 hypothetical protein B0I36DRAFT_387582 [Microdochium trichocladiopsis]
MLQPQSPPSVPAAVIDSRRIRKRATDRKSQKKHRERQKSYIKQLEASLESLASCKDTDERMVTLLAARDQYKSRYEEAMSRINRMRDILCAADQAAGESSVMHLFDCSSMPSWLVTQPSSAGGGATPPGLEMNALDLVLTPATSLADDVAMALPTILPNNDNASHNGHDTTSIAHSLADMLTIDYYDNAGGYGSIQPSLGPTTFDNEPPPALRIPVSLDGVIGDHEHICLPRYATPVGPGDRHITSMLIEASREHAAQAFDLTPPTLQRVLSSKADLLAFRLYNYIAAYGPMPMHWHVTRSLDDYQQIPPFLRPLEIQRRIPHRICAGLIVWPDMRRCLVRDALSVSPEVVGTDLVRNLGTTWHPQLCVSGDLTTSMDLFVVLERQAASLEFWRCRPEFFVKYPQYAHCRMGQPS